MSPFGTFRISPWRRVMSVSWGRADLVQKRAYVTHAGSRPPGNGAPDRVQFRSSIGAGYQTFIGGVERMPRGWTERFEAT